MDFLPGTNIAGWNLTIFNRKYIDSIRVHFPAIPMLVYWSVKPLEIWDSLWKINILNLQIEVSKMIFLFKQADFKVPC